MLKFILPTTPKAQARPRVTVRGNGNRRFAHAYKTADQQANERTLEALLMPHRPSKPLACPVALEFTACLPVSRSDSKRTVEAKLSGKIWAIKKPDLDNLAKNLKDSMTRMGFWLDDAQVVELHCKKIWSERGEWRVSVYEALPMAERPIPEVFAALREEFGDKLGLDGMNPVDFQRSLRG